MLHLMLHLSFVKVTDIQTDAMKSNTMLHVTPNI